MSVLDRAIVKAFQRRRDSEAVAKAAAVERRAVEESPTKPVVDTPDTSAFVIAESPAIGSYQQQIEPPLPPPLPKEESVVSDAFVATMAPERVQSEPISSYPSVLSELPPHRREPEFQEPIVQVQSASASHGRATYTSSFTRTSEPAPNVDNSAVTSPKSPVGYSVTEMSAAATPPLPSVIERPVPQQWKWPEICEQLDQFTGEGFRQLAKHLQFAAEQGHKTLAFVSSAPGAGRTSVLLTLTRILALEGQTDVLLIDADRRHPQLASLTAPQPTAGLREVLHGQLRMEQAVIPMNPGRVAVLPLNENLTDGEWLQLVAPMRVLLKQARRDYDMILIDAGVLGPETRLADCWLRGAADAVITISRQLTGKQTEHEVLDWKQIGIESLGVIETFA